MIKISIPERGSCDNCNREMPIAAFEFFDKGIKNPYVMLGLCEDCLNSLQILYSKSRKEGKSYKYDLDEITQVDCEGE